MANDDGVIVIKSMTSGFMKAIAISVRPFYGYLLVEEGRRVF